MPKHVKEVIQKFPGQPSSGPAAGYDKLKYFWHCMDRDFDRPDYEEDLDVYGRFYTFTRTRGQHLRIYLPQHKNRWSLAARKKLEMNELGKTYWLLRNSRLGKEQRRWALMPVRGDLSRFDDIYASLQTMPEELAAQDVQQPPARRRPGRPLFFSN